MLIKIFRFLIFLIVFNVNCEKFTLHDGSVVEDADKIFAKLQNFACDKYILMLLYTFYVKNETNFSLPPQDEILIQSLVELELLIAGPETYHKNRLVELGQVILNSIVVDSEEHPTRAMLINPFKP